MVHLPRRAGESGGGGGHTLSQVRTLVLLQSVDPSLCPAERPKAPPGRQCAQKPVDAQS